MGINTHYKYLVLLTQVVFFFLETWYQNIRTPFHPSLCRHHDSNLDWLARHAAKRNFDAIDDGLNVTSAKTLAQPAW
ncbi:hypothetical protein ACN38_g1221 [Penicillium nordicum]|uniref:Uncharacterized protein n=1 Tax=Penicillium nordicum TaxID=229535 RepID=A0A0M8PHI4_9EURO|nr:hypothetical protein ACN38_g1221 [Penicillium nordicum]